VVIIKENRGGDLVASGMWSMKEVYTHRTSGVWT
jgi:hypothetical protein